MEGRNGIKEISEAENQSTDNMPEYDEIILDKYDKILGDDKIEAQNPPKKGDANLLSSEERAQKYNKLFHLDDSEYELDGDVYEMDDNGVTYKKNGQLLANVEYVENSHIYQTDHKGRIKSCDGNPQYTDEGDRNMKEQKEAGGDERQDDDDGGHIIARILNGPEGSENLVPMRRTINRGDYKKMENEIAKAIQEGQEATMHINLAYDGESQRPSKMEAEYMLDKKKTLVEFDNKENSTELLGVLEGRINDRNYQELKDEIEDMKADGVEASVTSVKLEYDEKHNLNRVVVGLLDESTGKKTYKVYEPKGEV